MKVAVLTAEMTLLEAAKQGDDGAFEILLAPLLEPGYRLAGGMLQDHQAGRMRISRARGAVSEMAPLPIEVRLGQAHHALERV